MSVQSEKFAERVHELVGIFRSAINATDWVTQEYPKKMRDEDGNLFTVPTLTLQKGPTRLYLDPTGYDIPGAEGVADLYLMPTGEPVASLYLKAGDWTIHSPFPSKAMVMAKPKEWGQANVSDESIQDVLEAIGNDAVPSN
jgi:hypothetical protein